MTIDNPGLNSNNPRPGEEVGQVCIANISPAERMKRLIAGIIPFVLALIILGVLILIRADRLWRLPLFLLFAMAGTGYFQWRDKT
jgi:hypothetical protein